MPDVYLPLQLTMVFVVSNSFGAADLNLMLLFAVKTFVT
jgi:hypothetical protein